MTKPIPKDQQKKRGPKPKDGATPPPKPAPSGDEPQDAAQPVKPVDASKPSNTPLKDLAARIVAERSGDPRRAQEPKPKRDKPSETASAKKKQEAEPVDMEMVDALAGAMAAGEAEAAAIAVPAEHADDVRKRSSGILKFAWKYHFIQNGINGFPSWAVLLVAHFAAVLMILSPNKDRIVSWYNDFTGKVPDPKDAKKPGKVVDEKPKPATPTPPPAPVATLPNGETGQLRAPGALETGAI